MKNTTELRGELSSVFKDLKARKIDADTAKGLVKVSNTMIKSAAVEADYNKFIGDKSEIKFLKTPTR